MEASLKMLSLSRSGASLGVLQGSLQRVEGFFRFLGSWLYRGGRVFGWGFCGFGFGISGQDCRKHAEVSTYVAQCMCSCL